MENHEGGFNEEIAPAILILVLEGEMVEAMRGQFLHLCVPDAHLLRRPITCSLTSVNEAAHETNQDSLCSTATVGDEHQ